LLNNPLKTVFMKKNYVLALSLFAGLIGMAQTTTLVNYDFNSASSYPLSGTNASGITSSLTSSESFQTYTGVATGTSAFTQNTTDGQAIAMANSSGTNTRYFLLHLSGSSLNNYQAIKMYLQPQRSSTGATVITVAYSLDGTSYTNLSSTISVPTAFSENTVDLSATGAASNLYIKIMASGASGTGTLRIDNIELQGSLTPFTSSGSNITFNGVVTAPTLTVTGDARVSGNLSTANINSTGTTSLTTLNVSGNAILNQLSINQSLSSPKFVTTRILGVDTNGIHFGDSSIVMLPTQYANNPIQLTTNVPYERIYVQASNNNITFGTKANIAVGGNSQAYGTGGIKAFGQNSIAFGLLNTETDALNSMAIGYHVKTAATATNSIAFGAGTSSVFMTNSTPNSLAVGFNSTIPTLLVTGGTGANTVGQVFIGKLKQLTSAGAATNHQNAILQVNGDMVVGAAGTNNANIWVTASNWADFVFDKNYELMPLNELEKFYKTNHHLPNVPTQKDIQEQGNNLAQTDVVLLQKIEENTLYIVELKKQLEAQQKLIDALAKKLSDKNP
jgi:hypothetical protein